MSDVTIEALKQELSLLPYNELRKMAKGIVQGRSRTKEQLVDAVANDIAARQNHPTSIEKYPVVEPNTTFVASSPTRNAGNGSQDTSYQNQADSMSPLSADTDNNYCSLESLDQHMVHPDEVQEVPNAYEMADVLGQSERSSSRTSEKDAKHRLTITAVTLIIALVIGVALVDRRAWADLRQSVASNRAFSLISYPQTQASSMCSKAPTPAVFDGIVPPSILKRALISHQAARSWTGPRKAATFLLASDAYTSDNDKESDLQKAARLLISSAEANTCDSCVLHELGENTPKGRDGRGALQKLLAEFHKRCPYGVVVFEGLHSTDANLLPVFINALSEQGHFEHQGKQVDTSHAMYIFTAAVPQIFSEQQEYEVFQSQVKEHLLKLWEQPTQGESPVTAAAMAFRRRIDAVLPVQLSS